MLCCRSVSLCQRQVVLNAIKVKKNLIPERVGRRGEGWLSVYVCGERGGEFFSVCWEKRGQLA